MFHGKIRIFEMTAESGALDNPVSDGTTILLENNGNGYEYISAFFFSSSP